MDLDYEYEPINDSANLEYNYPNQQIFEPGKGMLNWAINRLEEPLGEYVDFNDWKGIEELQTLVHAGWWKFNQKQGIRSNEILQD